jgi:hypothetical protein
MGSYCVYFEGKMMDNNHMLIERSLIIMGKHLTLDERTIIQVSLGEGKTLGEIAKTLGKATSTISREVRNHAVTVRKGAYGYVLNECVHRHHCRENGICISKPDCVTKNCRFCKECNSNCSKFEREVCSKHPMCVMDALKSLNALLKKGCMMRNWLIKNTEMYYQNPEKDSILLRMNSESLILVPLSVLTEDCQYTISYITTPIP